MDREILFRGKRLEVGRFASEKVCEWVYGGYAKDCSGAVHIYDPTRASRMVRVDPATVSRYTGLTDKNGVKIFEGDIIFGKSWRASKEGRFVVRWRAVSCEFSAGEGKTWWPQMNQYEMSYYEVIGNVHDNPELLEEEPKNV